MATRYYSFNIFMQDVIENANTKVQIASNDGKTLEDIFEMKNERIIAYVIAILKQGWWVFIAVAALLILGPAGFVAALASFLITGPGIIVAGIFGAGAYKTLRELYRNKELPLAVKEVGNEYKPKWKHVEGNYIKIDALLDEAAISLVRKASKAQKALIDKMLNDMYKN